MWCTQVNTSLPQNPYFPPVGRPLAVSGCSGSGVRLCLADESNVPSGPELRSRIVGQDWMPSWNCLYSKPPWLMQPLFSSPFSFSPAAAVHHKQDPGLCSPPPEFFLFVFLLLLLSPSPPLLGVSWWQIHPRASGTSAVTTRQLDKLATTLLWPSSNVLELLWMIWQLKKKRQ